MSRFVLLTIYTLAVIALSRCKEGDRQLKVFVNPQCEQSEFSAECNSSKSLAYVRADGVNDTLHYLWSSVGSFSILMAQTSLQANLSVNWAAFLSGDPAGSISFTEHPLYTSVVVLTRLYEYEDTDDKNDIKEAEFITSHIFANLTWDDVEASNATDNEVSAKFKTNASLPIGDNSIQINLKAYGYDDNADILPHLLHTPHSFQLELVLDNFNTIYNHTRFVLEVVAFGDDSGKYTLKTHRSIDDEYTPSVFTTVLVASPRSQEKGWGSYLQWKPICYTSSDRSTEKSTSTNEELLQNDISENRTSELSNSLAAAYYNASEPISLTGWVHISYGLQGDNFYQDGYFLTWTVTLGLGIPPSEKFSTLVIAVIIVGFGVPVILIITGGIVLLIRRFRAKDDDLNLSSAKLCEDEEQEP